MNGIFNGPAGRPGRVSGKFNRPALVPQLDARLQRGPSVSTLQSLEHPPLPNLFVRSAPTQTVRLRAKGRAAEHYENTAEHGVDFLTRRRGERKDY